ncbi:MAG: PD40 domain-containing protein [Armatimonadetes bacterium]|nr:PD40 domain-containing protein [Armatimonadota bacterium]
MLTAILTLVACTGVVQEPDGSWEKRLTKNVAYDGSPVFSPDGTKIAFVSERDYDGQGYEFKAREIYIMNADGTGQTRLTNNEAYDELPTFSPDGSKIAFMSDRDGNDNIYIMNADGSGQTRLTDSEAYDQWPAFSPDGSKIAFQSGRDGWSDVYIMNTDGSGQTRLTDEEHYDYHPVFSPDGSKIAFMSFRYTNTLLYVMNADGTDEQPLIQNPTGGNVGTFNSNWSKITYGSSADTWSDDEIYVMNADGSGVTRMRNHPAHDRAPAFSPDGSLIVFQTDRDGNDEIYVMNTVQEVQPVVDWVKVIVSTEKQLYEVGEEITFDVRIVNTSSGSFTILYLLARGWNFSLDIYDADGNSVDYENRYRVPRIIPPDSPSDFVKLESGGYFGHPGVASTPLDNPGEYRVQVTVFLGRYNKLAKELGIDSNVRVKVVADPIYITVSSPLEEKD